MSLSFTSKFAGILSIGGDRELYDDDDEDEENKEDSLSRFDKLFHENFILSMLLNVIISIESPRLTSYIAALLEATKFVNCEEKKIA